MGVCYYWYHHMMDEENRKAIQRCIDNKDFEGFMMWRRCLSEYEKNFPFDMVFLPPTALAYEDEDSEPELIYILEKENFMKITFSESECG